MITDKCFLSSSGISLPHRFLNKKPGSIILDHMWMKSVAAKFKPQNKSPHAHRHIINIYNIYFSDPSSPSHSTTNHYLSSRNICFTDHSSHQCCSCFHEYLGFVPPQIKQPSLHNDSLALQHSNSHTGNERLVEHPPKDAHTGNAVLDFDPPQNPPMLVAMFTKQKTNNTVNWNYNNELGNKSAQWLIL